MTTEKKNPLQQAVLGLFLFSGLSALITGIVLMRGAGVLSVPVLVPLFFAWFLGFVGVHLRRVLSAAPLLDRSLDCVSRGQLAEAEALLASIPAHARRAPVLRAMHIQRAMIAVARDDAAAARAEAAHAIEHKANLTRTDAERLQILEAHAIRAVACAQLGDAAGARADAAVVRASPLAMPSALARVTLADALVLARQGSNDELAALLRRERRSLLENVTPRQRVIVRALQRSLYTPSGSVYRVVQRPQGEPRAHAPLEDLVRELAPPDVASGNSVAPRARRLSGQLKKTLVLWAVLVAMFVGIWQFLTPAETARHVAPRLDESGNVNPASQPLFWVVWVAAFLAIMATLRVINRRSARRYAAAMRLLASDVPAAEGAFTKIARSRLPLLAAGAEHQLARLAWRDARFSDALTFCDRGLARVKDNAIAGQLLTPQLRARRALCLAAIGRNAEATAALRDLADRHPTYPMMAGAQLVGRMLQALRAGDLAAAHQIAARRTPDLPIELEEETLADLLVTTGDPSPMADEIARLDAELKEDAELRDWVCAVWPKAESYVEMAAARVTTA